MKSILFLFIIFSINYVYSQVYLNDICFSDSLHGCAVGNSGTILYSSDGGVNWLLSDSHNPSRVITSVYCLDSLNSFTTVDNGKLLRSYDGCESWQQTTNFNHQTQSIIFIDSVTGFVTAWQTFISRTTDKGESWSTVNIINGSEIGLFSIGFVNENEGWAAGSTSTTFLGALLWTEDGGQSWSVIDSSMSYYIRDAQFVSTNTGFLATLDGIFKTTDKGTNWVRKYQWDFYSIYFLNEQTGWAAGYGGKIVKTIDGGETWITLDNPATDDLRAVYFINENRGWAVGGHTTIISTTDGGNNWFIQLSVPTSVNEFKSQPIEFTLKQNYPNPFNPTTTIEYTIQKPGNVKIIIYDVLGREVKMLVNEFKNSGNYKEIFNAGNLGSGIYYYQLINEENIQTKPMLLLK